MPVNVTAAEIRTWSDVEFGALGYPEPVDTEPDRLDHLVLRAEAELAARASYRVDLEALDVDSTNPKIKNKALLAQEIIQRLVEYASAKGQHEILETAADFNLIQGFNVSGYSETRRGWHGMSRVANDIHPWPLVQALIDLLIWFDTGGVRAMEGPAMAIPGQDWTVGEEALETIRYPMSRVGGSFLPLFFGTLPIPGWQGI